MELLENFNFYEDCKNAIIESYGNVDVAKMKLMNGKYSDVNEDVLCENLHRINEGIGDKIMNFLSRNLGGDVGKIDKILQGMKEEETKFITDEHEAENKFYKLSAALAQLRSDKADKTELDSIRVKLVKIQKLLRDLVSSHNSIMDDFEKQVNVLTKKSNRKAEYYNLKRAEDSVETKKMRAEFKKKLLSASDEDGYLKGIQDILGDPKKAEDDLKKSQDNLDKIKNDLGAKDETTKMPAKTIKNVFETYSKEILASVKELGDFIKKESEEMKKSVETKSWGINKYKNREKTFEDLKKVCLNLMSIAISKISVIKTNDNENVQDKDKCLTKLRESEKRIGNLKFIEYPVKNTPNADNPDSIKDYKDNIYREASDIEGVLEEVEEKIKQAA
jgi:hypothetical protein